MNMKHGFVMLMLAGLALVAGCGDKPKESLTKRTARKLTNKALDAVDGVTEVLAERGQKSAQTATKAAGEVAVGISDGVKQTADVHGERVGSNVVSAVAPVLISASHEASRYMPVHGETNAPKPSSDQTPKP